MSEYAQSMLQFYYFIFRMAFRKERNIDPMTEAILMNRE